MLNILGKPWWHFALHVAFGALIAFIISATAQQQALPAMLGVISAAIAKEATDIIDARDDLISASGDVIEWVLGGFLWVFALALYHGLILL